MIYYKIGNQLFDTQLVNFFLTKVFYNGKKSKSDTPFLKTLIIIQNLSVNTSINPISILIKAIENSKPYIEVQSIRIAGTTYRVPVEINKTRQYSLAMRWLIESARRRSEKTMSLKLAKEIFETANNNSTNTLKKKEEMHKMAEASRAYINYRW